MAVPVAKHNFTSGELSPSMLGRQDVERYGSGGTTVRNLFVDYVGGLKSRGGTAFTGYSKQTGRSYPHRLVPFQFAFNQALMLEFGNQYMRVISDGAYVTETPIGVTNVALTNPAQLTITANSTVSAATPVNTNVTNSYAPGDQITLAGGTYLAQAILSVTTTAVTAATVTTQGTHYAPGDTVTCAGGSFTSAAEVAVATTQIAFYTKPTIVSGGSGGTNGTQTVTGTTGSGTRFQLQVIVSGGQITSISSVSNNGAYTANPSNLSHEPVTGAGLSGAIVGGITMAAQTVTISSGGVYTANPTGQVLTQGSTSGSGTGIVVNATFAPHAATVYEGGSYSVVPSNPVAQASTSGVGVGAEFNLTTSSTAPDLNVGDWVYVSGLGGTVQLNGETFVVGSLSGSVITLNDVFGNTIDATGFSAYTSGGGVARIYTLSTIYNEQDLPWLKAVQSADTMSICCVNQNTQTEYPPQDLTRTNDTSWAFSPVVPAPSVLPPASVSGSASTTGTVTYQYVVTSIDPTDGTESIASSIATIDSAVDIASTAGSITLTWSAVDGVNEYYIYKALPVYGGAAAQAGAEFGYAGLAYGVSFVDSNIVADFTQTPPTHNNPFGRGVIIGGTPTSGGSSYTAITLTPNSSTGSGGVLTGVLSSGALAAVIVDDQGINYLPGDTISISGTGGSGAAASLQVGPQSGTYPSVPAYFQERRGYANSLNNPDTYWFSQPGSFTNFDVRNPTIASDAITGSPWAVQVNGVQWMIQTSGGLLVMTGLRAWMLVGAGSFATNVQPISPSEQNDVPQAFSGVSPLVQPQLINYDVVYVDANGIYYYDLPYQLYALSEPIEMTDISEHLFTGYTVVANAYCEKPFRLVWDVRNDGIARCMTFYKTQKVQGWTRHDTQGYFVGVASIIEPPVNAAYFATQRFINGNSAYMTERMDNRIWQDAESVWAVDCGLSYPQPQPAASLTISSATGLGSLTGATGIVGGSGYSSGTVGSVVDDFNGPGTGAVPVLTFSGGALTGVSFSPEGAAYTQPRLILKDPAGSAGGSGASARITLNNATTLTASAAVFSSDDVGAIVRAAGGIAEITSRTSPTVVTANVLSPFVGVIPNSNGALPVIPAGSWTKTTPTMTVTGLRHLAGATVTGLADGNVIPPTVVSASGSVTLGAAASAITIGLGFQCQFQDVPIDMGNPTVQGQRKRLAATTLRLESSRGVKVGANQRDGSSLSPMQVSTVWNQMQPIPETPQAGAQNFPPPPYNALCNPLVTGDVRLPLSGGLATPGQLCVQQDYPLPCDIVALYMEALPGDNPAVTAPQKARK